MNFRMQDLMIDTLPTTGGAQPGRLLCGSTSCAKSAPLEPVPPPDPPEPGCGPSSCGARSIPPESYQAAAHLGALQQQLRDTLAGMA